LWPFLLKQVCPFKVKDDPLAPVNNKRKLGMDKIEALRSIHYDLVEYIQQRVKVDFDNWRQAPASFTFKGKTHLVGEVLGRFRMQRGHPMNAFLVNVNNEEVYLLYFQLSDIDKSGPIQAGFWILSLRVLNDRELMAFYREERKMLVNMTLKKVVDFHGHLCPDLVIGCKACEYALKLVSKNGSLDRGISVIAENSTSALDAIQVLFGATIGNQHLKVLDFGKHNYIFSFENGHKALRLSMRRQHYCDGDEYRAIEDKIVRDEATLDEVVHFQRLLDGWVRHLFNLSYEELFDVEWIESVQPSIETASVYMTCCKCGQQVLRTRKIDYQGKIYCIPCFQQVNPSCIYYRLQ